MAECNGTQWDGSDYGCGSNTYYTFHARTDFSNFRHYSGDASQALLSINYDFNYYYWNIKWATSAGRTVAGALWYRSSVATGDGWRFAEATIARWYGCCGQCGTSGSGNYYDARISASDTRVYVDMYDTNWVENWGWHDTLDCQITYDLPTNMRITAPTGFTATLGSYSLTSLHCEASIASWSNNTNIKGTPYTSGGGRSWNFMAEIKNPAGTSLYRIEKNTGETKSCSWDFSGMNLPVNTTLTLRIVVSNDYQQIQEKLITFQVKPIGKVITTGSEKWIFAGDRIASVEEGEGITKIVKFGKVVG